MDLTNTVSNKLFPLWRLTASGRAESQLQEIFYGNSTRQFLEIWPLPMIHK